MPLKCFLPCQRKRRLQHTVTILQMFRRKQILNYLCTKMTDFKRQNKDLILQKKKNVLGGKKKIS